MTVKVILDAAEGFVDSGTTPTINHQCPPNAFDYRTPKPGSPSAGLGDTRSEAPMFHATNTAVSTPRADETRTPSELRVCAVGPGALRGVNGMLRSTPVDVVSQVPPDHKPWASARRCVGSPTEYR